MSFILRRVLKKYLKKYVCKNDLDRLEYIDNIYQLKYLQINYYWVNEFIPKPFQISKFFINDMKIYPNISNIIEKIEITEKIDIDIDIITNGNFIFSIFNSLNLNENENENENKNKKKIGLFASIKNSCISLFDSFFSDSGDNDNENNDLDNDNDGYNILLNKMDNIFQNFILKIKKIDIKLENFNIVLESLTFQSNVFNIDKIIVLFLNDISITLNNVKIKIISNKDFDIYIENINILKWNIDIINNIFQLFSYLDIDSNNNDNDIENDIDDDINYRVECNKINMIDILTIESIIIIYQLTKSRSNLDVNINNITNIDNSIKLFNINIFKNDHDYINNNMKDDDSNDSNDSNDNDTIFSTYKRTINKHLVLPTLLKVNEVDSYKKTKDSVVIKLDSKNNIMDIDKFIELVKRLYLCDNENENDKIVSFDINSVNLIEIIYKEFSFHIKNISIFISYPYIYIQCSRLCYDKKIVSFSNCRLGIDIVKKNLIFEIGTINIISWIRFLTFFKNIKKEIYKSENESENSINWNFMLENIFLQIYDDLEDLHYHFYKIRYFYQIQQLLIDRISLLNYLDITNLSYKTDNNSFKIYSILGKDMNPLELSTFIKKIYNSIIIYIPNNNIIIPNTNLQLNIVNNYETYNQAKNQVKNQRIKIKFNNIKWSFKYNNDIIDLIGTDWIFKLIDNDYNIILSNLSFVDNISTSVWKNALWTENLNIKYSNKFLGISPKSVINFNIDNDILDMICKYINDFNQLGQLDQLDQLDKSNDIILTCLEINDFEIFLNFKPKRIKLMPIRDTKLLFKGIHLYSISNNSKSIENIKKKILEEWFNFNNIVNLFGGIKHIKPLTNISTVLINFFLIIFYPSHDSNSTFIKQIKQIFKVSLIELLQLGASLQLPNNKISVYANQPISIKDGINQAYDEVVFGIKIENKLLNKIKMIPLGINRGFSKILLGICNQLDPNRIKIMNNKYK
jgi:hypothetical protein